ncbi:uncharacterized protein [Dysidea avara]
MGSSTLVKDDRKIRDVGIRDNITLTVIALSVPDKWDIFVTVPGMSAPAKITMEENKPISALYGEVRKVTGKQVIVLFSGEDLIEENNSQLQSEIFDGVKLTLSTTITLFVVVDKQYTIHISPIATVKDLIKEIKAKTTQLDNISDEQLRFMVGTLNFDTQNNLSVKIMDPPANMKHSSTIVVAMRQRGGGDPRIQVLQNCGNKSINGVSTPSLRACPHCGALVQHTEACKNMTCPACSKGFCFICLKPRNSSGVLPCGSACSPAPRQTSIPG